MRLTNDMKDRIEDGLVNDAYTSKELAEIKVGLAKEIRRHPYIRKGIDIAKRYPDYIFASHSVSLVRNWWDIRDLEAKETAKNIQAYATDMLDIDAMFAMRTGKFTVSDKVDELTEKGQEWWDRLVDYCNGKAKLRKDIETILSSINTSKQLVDILPEAKKYIPEETQNVIVPIEVINRAKEVINGRTKAV